MPLLLEPKINPDDLKGRLTLLRRRLRALSLARGISILASLLLASVLIAGILDRFLGLPSLVRAGLLAATLLAALAIGFRSILAPRRRLATDLDLALRIEDKYPILNDSLASTIQFKDASVGSEAMRTAAARLALRETRKLDFSELLVGQGPGIFGFIALSLGAIGIAAGLLSPGASRTGLLRFADPFGDHAWPTATELDIEAPHSIPRGEPFIIRGQIRGVIPDRAVYSIALDNSPASEHIVPAADGFVAIRVEPNRIPRSFRFQVRANDATTSWKHVAVVTPPQFVSIDGRVSPRVTVEFPRYSEVPPRELPDGSATFEVIPGTLVRIQAATDRPLSQAWIVLDAESARPIAATAVQALGGTNVWSSLANQPVSRAVLGPVPVSLAADRTRFVCEFSPAVAGMYALRFADAEGLGGKKVFDIRLITDPPPTVRLDRPSPARENLSVLANAVINIVARADDPMFAVHSMALEYQVGGEETFRQLPIGNAESIGLLAKHLLSPWPIESPRFRPTSLSSQTRFPLDRIRLSDGRSLRDGDIVKLRVVSRDFDDVTPWKPLGQSHEVEIRIVSEPMLDALVQKAKTEALQEIQQLQKLQKQATELAEDAAKDRSGDHESKTDQTEKLLQAEQIQQQVNQRLGTKDEGLIGALSRLRQSLKDNPQANSSDRDRVESLLSELDRIANEEVNSAQQQLSAARREQDSKSEAPSKKSAAISRAVQHQRETERTLRESQEMLKPWTDARELRTDAAMLQRELDRAQRQREQFEQKPGIQGADPDRLTKEQRDELARLQERQAAVAERASELTGKLNQRINEKTSAIASQEAEATKLEAEAAVKEKEANESKSESRQAELQRERSQLQNRSAESRETVETMRRELASLNRARDSAEPALADQLRQAGERVASNRLGEARQAQQQASQTLEKIQKELAEPENNNVDRLAKKLADAQRELQAITDEQERLQRKSQDLGKISDASDRKKALEQLSRDQEALQEKTRELAQRLSRLKNESAAQELRRASRAMEQAAGQMAQGETPEDRQDDALDRLEDAQREVADAQKKAEEELEREQRAKVVDLITGFRDRQHSLSLESERIFREVKAAKIWSRATHQKSLFDLAESQKGLASEVTAVADSQFKDSKLVGFVIRQAAESMNSVGDAVDAVRDNQWSLDSIDEDASAVQLPQKTAIRRLNQLIEVLKSENKDRQSGPKPAGENQPKPDQPGATKEENPSESAAPTMNLSMLKLLRSLQADLNEQTSEFDRKHPDAERWSPIQKKELGSIRRIQSELAALFDEIAPPPPVPNDQTPKKDKPGETIPGRDRP